MSVSNNQELVGLKNVDRDRVSPELKDFIESSEEEVSFVEVIEEKVGEIVENHKGKEEALIEVLHQTQELIGFIPREVQKMIATGLNITPGEVASVISFYAHFTELPKGKYQIALCKGTACYVKGSAEIIEKISSKYGLEPGQTTEDGLFSLEVVRCLGACGLSPVMTVNGKAHGLLNPEKAINILEKYKNNQM